MLISAIVKVVRACVRRAPLVVACYIALALGCGYYAATHFAINTDIDKMISPTLEWRKHEIDYEKSFPGRYDSILVVVDAPTPELAAQAATALAAKLKQNTRNFHAVEEIGGGPFFAREGLLFQSVPELTQTVKGMGEAVPLVRTIVGDPDLRGLAQIVTLLMQGVRGKLVELDSLARGLNLAAATTENVLAGKPASFSWQEMMDASAGKPERLRRLINVRPVLDFSALEAGGQAANAIREAARALDLAGTYRARVRLTGPVAMSDEEFSTLSQGAFQDTAATIAVVLLILWLALRSGKLILAVFINLAVGLSTTAAIGLWLVDALNPISVAFAVLFIGLGVDFGIQFAVRYRTERHAHDNLRGALLATARKIGAPLTLAAAAVAAAFLSFTPTDYTGISELGIIAGIGMLVAFTTSITLLPALIAILRPPGEPEEIGYTALAPLDHFLTRHRIAVVGSTAAVALLGLPLLTQLSFDFNTLNLRNKQTESVATLLELQSDPAVGASAISVLMPTPAQAATAAQRLGELPQAGTVMTLSSFVPDHQEEKLALIATLKKKLEPALNTRPRTPPTDAQNVTALKETVALTNEVVENRSGPGAETARRLATDLSRLADASAATRTAAATAFLSPLKTVLDDWRNYLKAEPVTIETLPEQIRREWITADGRYRVDVQPKGDPNDTEVLRTFARAVLKVYPNASGMPVTILKAGETVVDAFIQAGIYALISITILLWIVLRRFGDVLLTLVPLLLAGVLSLEICVLIGLPLNFANIIALPLLLGVGVAFKIYYIMAWRAGQTNLLQSSLTRAVVWSALTTATAFGSLWMSSHPGTSSMGKLLALSLVTTMCAAVLFQPALMGQPRKTKTDAKRKPAEANA